MACAWRWRRRADGLLGILGGGLGFIFGEMLQCFGRKRVPFGPKAQAWIDWWKVMEITFGLFGGLFIAMGWVQTFGMGHPAPKFKNAIPLPLEVLGIAVWLPLAVIGHQSQDERINDLWELPFQALIIPVPCIFCGSVWPAFAVMPLLTLASARQIIWEEYYCREKYIGRKAMLALVWGAFAVTAMIAYRWWSAGQAARTWLLCALAIQTGAAAMFAFTGRRCLFPAPELKKKYGPLAGFIAAGSAFPTTVVFIAMLIAIMILTRREPAF